MDRFSEALFLTLRQRRTEETILRSGMRNDEVQLLRQTQFLRDEGVQRASGNISSADGHRSASSVSIFVTPLSHDCYNERHVRPRYPDNATVYYRLLRRLPLSMCSIRFDLRSPVRISFIFSPNFFIRAVRKIFPDFVFL